MMIYTGVKTDPSWKYRFRISKSTILKIPKWINNIAVNRISSKSSNWKCLYWSFMNRNSNNNDWKKNNGSSNEPIIENKSIGNLITPPPISIHTLIKSALLHTHYDENAIFQKKVANQFSTGNAITHYFPYPLTQSVLYFFIRIHPRLFHHKILSLDYVNILSIYASIHPSNIHKIWTLFYP